MFLLFVHIDVWIAGIPTVSHLLSFVTSSRLFLWRVKLSGVRQSKITKGTVWADLGGKGFSCTKSTPHLRCLINNYIYIYIHLGNCSLPNGIVYHSFNIGTKYFFSCKDGFELVGSKTGSCDAGRFGRFCQCKLTWRNAFPLNRAQ